MEKIILVCDECGTEQGQGNHWFFAAHSENPPRLNIGPLDNAAGAAVGKIHLCGMACALKHVSNFLDATLKGAPHE